MDLFGLLMGGGMPSANFKEIVRLHEMLEKERIPHTFTTHMGGYLLRYFGINEFTEEDANGLARGIICSVIENAMSYGHENDLLEIQGLNLEDEADDVVGYLTADDVFERIKKDYNNRIS